MLKAAPYPNTGNVGAVETHRTRRLDLHLQHRCPASRSFASCYRSSAVTGKNDIPHSGEEWHPKDNTVVSDSLNDTGSQPMRRLSQSICIRLGGRTLMARKYLKSRCTLLVEGRICRTL